MSLTCPPIVGDQFPASQVAHTNFKTLNHVAPGCTIDQVVTDLVIKRLADIRELQPGWVATIRDASWSWTKSLCIYAVGLSAGAVALGGAVYGTYCLAEAHFGWQTYAAGITLELLLNKLGTGVTDLSFAYFLALNEAGKRAAKLSTKHDERTLQEKQADVERFRKEIRKELESVYDDCGKYLSEQAEKKVKCVEDGVKFRERIAGFEQKLPLVEKLLIQAGLNSGDIASALQRLKTRIQLVKEWTCELSTKPTSGDQNLKILSLAQEDSIRELAIPGEIHRRIDNARRAQMGTINKVKGYIGAICSGTKTCGLAVLAATALGAIGTLGYVGWYGSASLSSLFTMDLTPLHTAVGVAAAAIPVIGVIGKEIGAHSKAINENTQFVENELNASKKDLQAIYGNIANALQPDSSKEIKVPADLNKKLSLIREEISRLRIVKDPTEILGRLNPA